MNRKGGYVYIITNKNRTVLYIGSTSDIKKRRMFEHKNGIYKGFSKKYNCCDLVWFDFFPDITDGATKERQMKAWKREWKLNLIRQNNPDLIDLSEGWFDANIKLKDVVMH